MWVLQACNQWFWRRKRSTLPFSQLAVYVIWLQADLKLLAAFITFQIPDHLNALHVLRLPPLRVELKLPWKWKRTALCWSDHGDIFQILVLVSSLLSALCTSCQRVQIKSRQVQTVLTFLIGGTVALVAHRTWGWLVGSSVWQTLKQW